MDEPRIEEWAPVQLVGFETTFIHALSPDANAGDKIGPLWERYGKSCDQFQHLTKPEVCYGFIYAAPEAERAHVDERLYFAGTGCDATADQPEGTVIRMIPGGTYAGITITGGLDAFMDDLKALYRDWLPASPWIHSWQADVERYDERFKAFQPDSVFEYWISVKPREEASS